MLPATWSAADYALVPVKRRSLWSIDTPFCLCSFNSLFRTLRVLRSAVPLGSQCDGKAISEESVLGS
jgi:hypothetical protein